jgi:hypothetical protein
VCVCVCVCVCSTYTYRCIYLCKYRGLQAMSSASIKMMCESGMPIRFTCQARARKVAHERPHAHRQAHRGRPLAEERAGAGAWDEADVHACFGLTRVAVSRGDGLRNTSRCAKEAGAAARHNTHAMPSQLLASTCGTSRRNILRSGRRPGCLLCVGS